VYANALQRDNNPEDIVVNLGEDVTTAYARLEANLVQEVRTPELKKDEQRILNMIKIAEGKRKRALKNWEIQGICGNVRRTECMHASKPNQ
jgi:hypothetical protein